MPIQEAVTMVLVFAFLSMGTWGIISTVLEHRREMAKIKKGEDKTAQTMRLENSELKETVGMLQDRLAVLEQIATDPARRTAEEIEKLR